MLAKIILYVLLGTMVNAYGTSYQSVSNHVDGHAQTVYQPAYHGTSGYASQYIHGGDDGSYDHQKYYYPDHYPKYKYTYGVEDGHTHDKKSAAEERDGDVVKGHYTIAQPDGRTRIVHYTADKHNGFKAQVFYEGHATTQHPTYKHYF